MTTSKVSEVIEALTTAIAAAPPSLAPSIPFVSFSDATCRLEDVTDPGRFRLFEIKSESPTYGSFTWSVSDASFERVLRLRVGYPSALYYPEAPDEVTAEGQRYLTEKLKADDFVVLVKLIEAAGVLPLVAGTQLVQLRGEQDEAGGRVRSILYGLQYTQSQA